MNDFFVYSYETHEKHISLLKEIVRRTRQFAQLAGDDTLDIAKINQLLVEYNNLFISLPFKQVKGNMPFLPYTLFENLADMIGESNSLSAEVFNQDQYKLIVTFIGELLPYMQQLQALHHNTVVTIGTGKVAPKDFDEKKLTLLHTRYKFLIENEKLLDLEFQKENADKEKSQVRSFSLDDANDSNHSEENAMLMSFSFDDDDSVCLAEKKTTAHKIEENKNNINETMEGIEKYQKEYRNKYDQEYIYVQSDKHTNSNVQQEDGSSSSAGTMQDGMIFLSESITLKFKKINKILIERIDPRLIKCLKAIEVPLKDTVDNDDVNNIFSLYAALTFVNEVTHSRYLSEEHYYVEELEKVSHKVNFFRNRVVHSLDNYNTASQLNDIVMKDTMKLKHAASLLITYIDMLLDPNVKEKKELLRLKEQNMSVLFSNVAKSFGFCNYKNLQHPSENFEFTESVEKDLTEEERSIETVERFVHKSKNLIASINTLKNMTQYFKEYCKLESFSKKDVRKLFLKISESGFSPVHYVFLSANDLKNRLIIEGILQIMGEITGIIRKEAYFNELSIDATKHRLFEDFVVGITDYRNASTHRLRHDDINQVLDVLDAVKDGHFDILAREVEARLKLEEAALVQLKEMIIHKDDTIVFSDQVNDLLGKLGTHKAALRDVPISAAVIMSESVKRVHVASICCTM